MLKVKILLLLLLGSFLVQAQLYQPVKWSYSAKKLPKNEAEIYIKADISAGWHIYAMRFNDAPMRTSFRFKPSSAYALIGGVSEPKSVAKYDKTFQKHLYFFEREVVFKQKIKLLKSKAAVSGILEFMACSDKSCLPADEVPFQITVFR